MLAVCSVSRVECSPFCGGRLSFSSNPRLVSISLSFSSVDVHILKKHLKKTLFFGS